jgi:hypothetical protein
MVAEEETVSAVFRSKWQIENDTCFVFDQSAEVYIWLELR